MGRFSIRELGLSTWPDFARLAEKHHGVWGGCWCVFFHVERGWSGRTPAQNRADKERLVRANRSHAALVYDGADVVGWCQFGPPSELPRIDRMRGYGLKKPDLPDWRITCFFVDRERRHEGVARQALRGALQVIAAKGGGTVEAYPAATERRATSSSFLWNGTVSMFADAGFRNFRVLGAKHRVMRRSVQALRRNESLC